MAMKHKKTFTLLLAVTAVVAIAAMFAFYDHGEEEIRTEGIDTDSPARVETLAENSRLDQDGDILLGVAIILDKGWKTYWREAWESGLPPALDWSGSSNLASTQVLWPTPERFDDPGGSYLGYRDALVLPIVVEAVDNTHPLEAKLWLRYAVCREICIPLEERFVWHIAPANGSGVEDTKARSRLDDALKRVPVEKSERARFTEARLIEETDPAQLEIRVVLSDPLASDAMLVVEKPPPYFFGRERLVESIEGNDGIHARFTFPLLDVNVADEMRDSGVRILLKNGETSLSALVSVQ